MDNDRALVTLAGQARDYLRQSKAPNTRRAYRADWAHFESWCRAAGRTSLPASEDTLMLYFSALAVVSKVSTIERRLAALSQAHQACGFDGSIRGATLRALLAGIRRAKGTAPETKAPLLADELRTVLGQIPQDPRGLRDRALLLLGFAGGFRRSELVAVDAADVVFSSEGVAVTLRRSKTDPEGQGRKIGIPRGARPETCPVRALAAWLASAAITSGPLFRPVGRRGQPGERRLSDRSVALIVKQRVRAAGLDPLRYSGHSLRAGLATSAARNGASERSIMNQTGHRSIAMVRRYIREADLFHDNAAAFTGL
jgi:integrase